MSRHQYNGEHKAIDQKYAVKSDLRKQSMRPWSHLTQNEATAIQNRGSPIFLPLIMDTSDGVTSGIHRNK